jgi:quinol monooxygenase YgiN
MSDSLTLLVRIDAKADRTEEVKASLLSILEPTRAEAGCDSYTLYIDDKDPAVFIFVETWSTRAHWEAHNESAHLADFLALAETAVEQFTITEMSENNV